MTDLTATREQHRSHDQRLVAAPSWHGCISPLASWLWSTDMPSLSSALRTAAGAFGSSPSPIAEPCHLGNMRLERVAMRFGITKETLRSRFGFGKAEPRLPGAPKVDRVQRRRRLSFRRLPDETHARTRPHPTWLARTSATEHEQYPRHMPPVWNPLLRSRPSLPRVSALQVQRCRTLCSR